MARGVNKVILVGNLGHPPEVRYAQSGSAITTISLATSESWKDKNGEQQERTEWHKVKFFGKLAEIAGEYLTKGKQVYIEGALRTEKYADKQGVEKYTTFIVADEMQMLGGSGGQREERESEAPKRDYQGTTAAQRNGGGAPAPSRGPDPAHQSLMPDWDDSDVPF